jgi:hypothetical protein
MRYTPPAAAALIALLALTACDNGDSDKTPKFYCPTVQRLDQTSHLTAFLPSRDDVTAEITSATITGVAGACVYEPDKQAVRLTFKAGFTATNGPANNDAPLNLPYFVAVVYGQTILSKQLYSVPLSFDGNVSTASAISKNLTVELPNVRQNNHVQVLVGFQLTPEQQIYAADHPAP